MLYLTICEKFRTFVCMRLLNLNIANSFYWNWKCVLKIWKFLMPSFCAKKKWNKFHWKINFTLKQKNQTHKWKYKKKFNIQSTNLKRNIRFSTNFFFFWNFATVLEHFALYFQYLMRNNITYCTIFWWSPVLNFQNVLQMEIDFILLFFLQNQRLFARNIQSAEKQRKKMSMYKNYKVAGKQEYLKSCCKTFSILNIATNLQWSRTKDFKVVFTM